MPETLNNIITKPKPSITLSDSGASFCVAQLSEPGDKGLDPKMLQVEGAIGFSGPGLGGLGVTGFRGLGVWVEVLGV